MLKRLDHFFAKYTNLDRFIVGPKVEQNKRPTHQVEPLANLDQTNLKSMLQRSENICLEMIAPLRSLSQKLDNETLETRSLCNQLIKLVELERSSLRELRHKLYTQSSSTEISTQECSLSHLIKGTLKHLACPSSWFKESSLDFKAACALDDTQRGFKLLLSQISLFDSAPHITLGAGQNEHWAQIEIVTKNHLSISGPDQVRLDQDISYVRGIAERQGGTLQVHSTLNNSLKVSWLFAEAQAVENEIEEKVITTSNKSHIWLIDDEPGVRLTVKRWLQHSGYSVETFEEGQHLIESLVHADLKPALIICDADMPGMMGLEVLSIVSKQNPQIKRLLYTAREPNRWVIEAFNQGIVHRFIDKSEGPQALKTCLEDMLKADEEQNAQIHALDELLSQQMLSLHVQPLFSSETREVEAVEALMRSKHPAFRGPLDILNATQIAQREFDLQQVLSSLSKTVRETLPADIKLFMNIDPLVFGFPERLDEVFSDVYPYASSIVLELTERGQLCGDAWVESVKYLRAKGFEIALDDLGAGYNSLGAVAAVSPEIIKLDISLVSNVHLSNSKKEMVYLLSEYAQKHSMKTVAEGIEVADEAEVCSQLGIKWLQGYHLARPMPLEQFMSTYVVQK